MWVWWEYVIVEPLDRSKTVFSIGSSKAFTGSIPAGGHEHPSSIVGVSELWKNAQKMDKKNKASDIINKWTREI
jgi:hypothetical protein